MESPNNGDEGSPLTGSTEYKVIINEIQNTAITAATDTSHIHDEHHSRPQARSQSPDSVDIRFRIPLTAMFKRSLSAPASHSSLEQQPSHVRQESPSSVFANVVYDTLETPSGCDVLNRAGQHENTPHAVLGESIGDLSPLVLPSVLRDGAPARWNDVSPLCFPVLYRRMKLCLLQPYNLLETSIGSPPAPDCPGFSYTLSSPIDQSLGNDQLSAPTPPCEKNGSAVTMEYPGSYAKDWADVQVPTFINEFGASYVHDWWPANDPMCIHYIGTGTGYDSNVDAIHDQGEAYPNPEWHLIKS